MDGNSLDSWFMIGAIFLAAGREKTIHNCHFCSRGMPAPQSSSDPSQQPRVKWLPLPLASLLSRDPLHSLRPLSPFPAPCDGRPHLRRSHAQYTNHVVSYL
jgi:hypothetical protein